VPLSFDVRLLLNGEDMSCGTFWNCKPATNSMSSGGKLGTELDAPDPQIKEVTLVLDPNPGLIEAQPGVDFVWGRQIVFNHVPLVRQDLSKTGAAAAIPQAQRAP
jgi:hypothetical protein